MKNFFNLKKCLTFCLVFTLVFSVPVFASETSEVSAKWVNNCWGDKFEKNKTAENVFGVEVKSGEKYTASTDGGKAYFGYIKSTTDDNATSIENSKFLIIDVNLATPDDGMTVCTRTNRDLRLINNIPLEKGKWHSARLVVEKPLLEDADNEYFAKHKLYLDGKLVGEYKQDATSQKRQKNDKQEWIDNNEKWYIQVPLDKADTSVCYTDLRISQEDSEPGQTLPKLTTNEKFAVAGDNKIYSKSTEGLKPSDITYSGDAVTATRKEADGTYTNVSDTLNEGDTILVNDSNKFLNTYTYMGDKNVVVNANAYDSLKSVTGGSVEEKKEISGKSADDSSAVLKNNANNSYPYFNLGSAKDKLISADYIVFELNVKPNEKCKSVKFTSDGGYQITQSISSDALKKDCWNKIIIVVSANKNSSGKYTNKFYINGKSYSPVSMDQKLGAVVNSGESSKTLNDMRLLAECTDGSEAVEIAYIDDVKIYETFVEPTVSEYTVTNSVNAAYDSKENIIYASYDNAIATACSGTIAKSEDGYVIINRGDENYSRYTKRTIEKGKISIDATAKEFWGVADKIDNDDRLIVAKYGSDNKLSGVEILQGTKIGNNVIKGSYTKDGNETVKLYFWNVNTLMPKAESKPVSE